MSFIVSPTELDIGVNPNDGRAMTELNWNKIFFPTDIEVARWPFSHVRQGYTVAGTSGLNVDIAPGEAVIGAYTVRSDDTETVPVSPSTSVNIFLELLFSGNQISGAQLIEQAVNSIRANSILVAGAVTAAGSVSSTSDRRALTPSFQAGSYVGNGGVINIQLGYQPYKVEIIADASAGDDSVHSTILVAGVNRGWKIIGTSDQVDVFHAPGSGQDIPSIQSYGFQVQGSLGQQLSNTTTTYYWSAWR